MAWRMVEAEYNGQQKRNGGTKPKTKKKNPSGRRLGAQRAGLTLQDYTTQCMARVYGEDLLRFGDAVLDHRAQTELISHLNGGNSGASKAANVLSRTVPSMSSADTMQRQARTSHRGNRKQDQMYLGSSPSSNHQRSRDKILGPNLRPNTSACFSRAASLSMQTASSSHFHNRRSWTKENTSSLAMSKSTISHKTGNQSLNAHNRITADFDRSFMLTDPDPIIHPVLRPEAGNFLAKITQAQASPSDDPEKVLEELGIAKERLQSYLSAIDDESESRETRTFTAFDSGEIDRFRVIMDSMNTEQRGSFSNAMNEESANGLSPVKLKATRLHQAHAVIKHRDGDDAIRLVRNLGGKKK